LPIYKLFFTELAEGEYIEAFKYYEEQQEGLGEKFEFEIENIIKYLLTNPFIFQRKFKHYREAPLKKFPYFIVYEIYGKSIIINSIFHTSRNPKKKLKRKK
jgi:plasmid stabilization system protein ParE